MELISFFLILSFLMTLLISRQVVTTDSGIYFPGIHINLKEHKISDELEIVPNHNESSIQSRTLVCRRNYAFTQRGQSVYYQSPLYPDNYPARVRDSVCFSSPSGTTISVDCDEFNVQSSNRCSNDYLGISLDGRLRSYNKYCGSGIVRSPSSVANRLGVIFVSGRISSWLTLPNKRNFRCLLTVSGGPSPPVETTTTVAPQTTPPTNCNCGRRNSNSVSRVVGGTEAIKNEYPWRCYLMTTSEPNFCGCSIISSQWIMTAGHCTEAVRIEIESGGILFVVVGDHDTNSTSESASQQIAVVSIRDHPDFFRNAEGIPFNDISLLRLSRPITFSQTISPVCLPWNYIHEDFAGTTVTVSGWGRLFFQGPTPSILRKVDLPVLTSSECAPFYPPGFVTSNEICTYMEGKDACNGDSGGSMDLQRNGRHYAIGIVSWGAGCASGNRPGVYAKVTRFLNWIQAATGDTFCRA